MKNWQEDLLCATDGVQCEHAAFKKIEAAAQALGVEHCAFGLRVARPFSSPKTIVLNNYTESWWVRYVNENCLQTSPTVPHGHRTPTRLFGMTRSLAPRVSYRTKPTAVACLLAGRSQVCRLLVSLAC